jgi:MFS family permease
LQTSQQESSRVPLATPFYYGWVIVFMGAMGLFFSGPGQTYTISVFIDSYIQDFGWSRSLVSSMYSLATLLAGLLLFLVGRGIDHYGQRKVSIAIALLLGMACLWNSFITGPIMLFIGFFMLRLFGQGSMTLIPSTLVPQWFIKQRGRAMSLMALGGFLSSAALPPINTWMIDAWGWSAAWRVWTGLLFFVFVPLAFYLIRNKPEDIGLLPDPPSVQLVNTDGHQATQTMEESVQEENWTLSEAMRARAFWLILFCVAVPSMVNTGLTFHFFSILGESGITKTTSAFVLSIMAILALPVTLIAGFINERFKVHYVIAASFLGQVIVMFILLNTHSVNMAIVFGVVRGIVGGFEAISLGIIWPNYFGRKHLGSIKGFAMTTMVIGSAFGPLPFGIAYDIFGGYSEIIILMMLFPLLGIAAALASPQPKKYTLAD